MAELIFLSSTNRATLVPLEGEVVTLGRSADNTAQIEEPSMSRRHARVTGDPASGWTVEDLGSVNGIRLGGAELSGPTVMHDGDKLEFGSVKAFYRETSRRAIIVDEAALGAPKGDGPLVEVRSTPDYSAGVYFLEGFLGKKGGCMSYRAKEAFAGRPVSLKLVNPASVSGEKAVEELPETIEKILANPHPNLTRPLALERSRRQLILVSEWIFGFPLLDVLRHQRKLSVVAALRVLEQLAAALDHARSHGFPDLDLDPGAILLAPDAAAADGEGLSDALVEAPLHEWPPFHVKLACSLIEPQIEETMIVDDPQTVFASVTSTHQAPQDESIAFALSALMCEMLGYPRAGGAVSLGNKPPRIITLGERGNEVLNRGLTQPASFGSGQEFVRALADAARADPVG